MTNRQYITAYILKYMWLTGLLLNAMLLGAAHTWPAYIWAATWVVLCWYFYDMNTIAVHIHRRYDKLSITLSGRPQAECLAPKGWI